MSFICNGTSLQSAVQIAVIRFETLFFKKEFETLFFKKIFETLFFKKNFEALFFKKNFHSERMLFRNVHTYIENLRKKNSSTVKVFLCAPWRLMGVWRHHHHHHQ